MKSALLASLALAAAPALAQVAMPYEGDGAATAAFETDAAATIATGAQPGAGAAVTARDWTQIASRLALPANIRPERDARGIAVISAPAIAPAGWNGTPGTAMGGPELDPATGAEAAPASYPACTATVTDRCVQTYERTRRR